MGDLERYTKVYLSPDLIGYNLNIDTLKLYGMIENSLIIYSKQDSTGEVVYLCFCGLEGGSVYSENWLKDNLELLQKNNNIKLANVKYSNGSFMGIGWSIDNHPFYPYIKPKVKKNLKPDSKEYWKELCGRMCEKSISEIDKLFSESKHKFYFYGILNEDERLHKISLESNKKIKVTIDISIKNSLNNKVIIKYDVYFKNEAKASSPVYYDVVNSEFDYSQLDLNNQNYLKFEDMLSEHLSKQTYYVAKKTYDIVMKKPGTCFSIIKKVAI